MLGQALRSWRGLRRRWTVVDFRASVQCNVRELTVVAMPVMTPSGVVGTVQPGACGAPNAMGEGLADSGKRGTPNGQGLGS